MEAPKKHHLLITGTGRTGTTFLVKLLTMLDVDTGFTQDFMPIDQEARAGLEFQGLGGDLPYVIKNPNLMWKLPQLVKETPVVIDHVIVPIRDIEAAVASRIENLKKHPDMAPRKVTGGLEGVDRPDQQEGFFLKEFYHFFEFLSAFNIPVTLLQYPRLVLDGEYLYQKIGPLFDDIDQERFLRAFSKASDPALVHGYNKNCVNWLRYQGVDHVERTCAEKKPLNADHSVHRAELQRLRSDLLRTQQSLEKKLEQAWIEFTEEKAALLQDKEILSKDNARILSSRSWRYTRPFRLLMALMRFDKYYLYNAAQGIRTNVSRYRETRKLARPRFSRYIVEPCFQVTKRLFKPILRIMVYRFLSRPQNVLLDVTPYESEYQENQSFTGFSTDVKAIAFYLPQFHRIPENDRWWGDGFTEWTNTRKALPHFDGHYQPREPHDDFGYYDLSNIEVLKKQAKLARQHGIYGFCFYHYYFHGKRLLERPIEMLLNHPEIDLPFCLCWANENWTRRWDGADHEVLIEQKHSPSDDISFIEDLSRYFEDDRYIRVDGKPVVMVYHPRLLPNPAATFERWRQYCRNNSVGEIVIWVARSFAHHEGLGLEAVTEAEVEFPPHMTAPLEWMQLSQERNNKLRCPVSNYSSLAKNITSHKAFAEKLNHPIYRTAMLGWDNTARRGKEATVFYGFSLKLYYKWLRHIIKDARKKFPPESRFIFINAWNEWAEGTYLEPDRKYGYANINATSKALFDLPLEFTPGGSIENDNLRLTEPACKTPGTPIAKHQRDVHVALSFAKENK